MIKKTLTTLILFLAVTQSYAQTLTREDFTGLIPYLKTEDWKSAFSESEKLLQSAENDTSDYHAIILYIHIFSAAGMVTQDQMTHKELEKKVMKFQGQKVLMSAHKFSQETFDTSSTPNTAFQSATNAKGVNILCFEKFFFTDKINLDDYTENTFVRFGGVLEKIEINPNKSKIWILRLTVKDAYARKAN